MSCVGVPRVVHVVQRLDYGGLENGVVNLVNRMPRERYASAVVCVAGFGAEFRRRIGDHDVEVVSLDKRPGKDLPMYARMWRVLRRMRPAIVHTRNLGTVDMQWVAAAARVRGRVHGEHGWEAADPLGRNPKSLRIRRACRPVIQRYVPMSQDIARWLQRDVGVTAERIRQIYNGVDTERFTPQGAVAVDQPWASGPARARGGQERRPVVVGTVGRLDPVKNQAALLRAVRAVLDRHPELAADLRLVIAGDGPLRGALSSAARELGLADRVWFAGMRSDTPDIMRGLDVFVLPSMNEGISNTVLEAMASGVPVVAARVGGNPEIVVDGVTGMLYDAQDPDALVGSLSAYLANSALRQSHGLAGRSRVLRNFSLEAMVSRYADLYDEILGRTRELPRDLLPGSTGR